MKYEDLVGVEFKGSFWRDSKFISEARKDYLLNKKIDFWMKFLDYDPESGLFLAKGKDILGDSGLVGSINEEGLLKFKKIYAGERLNPMETDLDRFEVINYKGRIINPDKIVTMGGSYHIPGILNYSGNWRVDSLTEVFM